MDVTSRPSRDLKFSTFNKSNLKILHQNVRSLRNKTSELMAHLHPDLPHILCITEHHLNIMELNHVSFEKYTLGAQFCRTHLKKGGVVMYIHNNISFKTIDLSKFCKEKDIEICGVKLKMKDLSVCILTVYRSPGGDFSQFLLSLDGVLQTLSTSTQSFIICGDININYLAVSDQRKQLDNQLLLYNLVSIIDFPTRFCQTSSSAIDNIFLNTSCFNGYSLLPFHNDLSDHNAQILTINTSWQMQQDTIKIMRKIDKQTISDFIYKLSYESWDSVFNNDDVNLMFNSFLNIYLKIFYSCFPLIKIKLISNNSSWITLGIKTSCKRKRELFLLSKNSNNPAFTKYYKTYCRILTKVITEAKKLSYNNRILKSDNKVKTAWNITNEILGKHHPVNTIQKLTVADKLLIDRHDIAEALNIYFSTPAGISNGNIKDNRGCDTSTTYKYLDPQKNNQYPNLIFKSFSTQEILSIIKSLKSKSSSGYDEVNTKLLKISANYILSPLTYICNAAISVGIFPERLKYSIIQPIYKKGDATNPSNYRPISILTTFSKVLEKALYKRLMQHIDDNNILTEQQFGFRKGLSTEDAIFKLTHEILTALNTKTMIGSVFCDFNKAFDSVNHSLLLKKLPYYGINGKAKLMLESYLSKRYQRVQLNNSKQNCVVVSGWAEVQHGVPQGSVLGPLLFLLYINDLPNAIKQKALPVLFADDTSVLITSQNAYDLKNSLNISIHQLCNWFAANSLSLNFAKTLYLQFVTKTQNRFDIDISYGNNHIPNADNIKFLGVHINATLTWKNHIDGILPKLSSACFVMRSVKPYLSQQMLIAIYYSYFHSVMTYGIIFWGQSASSVRIFRLQKRIIRIMMGCRSRESCRNLFIKLGILPLPSQYIYRLLHFVTKNKEFFFPNNKIHTFNTRQYNDLHLPLAKLTKFQSGVHYMGVKLFNTLPAFVKQEVNHRSKFVHLLKKFLHVNSFYSLDEFYNHSKHRN